MKEDAEAHAEDDKKVRDLVDTRNQAENTVYQIRKQLEEFGEKVSPEVRGKIESALNDVEDKIKGDDADAMKLALEALNKEAMELGKVMYEQQAEQDTSADGADQAQQPEGDKPSDDDVIDAEYEVKE